MSISTWLVLQNPCALRTLTPWASAAFPGENRAPKWSSPTASASPRRWPHALYLALLLFRAFYDLTYRKTEAVVQDLMEDPFPSHPSLAPYALHHLDPSLLEDLLHRLAQEVEAHLSHQDPDPPFASWTPPA